MADDNSLRTYRSNDPSRRGSAAADEDARSHPSDPLAELARLIGQSDPFSGFARNNAGTPGGTGASTPRVANTMSAIATVTTISGMNQFPRWRRRKTLAGEKMMSIKSSHSEALGAPVTTLG